MERFHSTCLRGGFGEVPWLINRGGGDIQRLMWMATESKGQFVQGWSGKIPMPCVVESRFLNQCIGIGLRLQDLCIWERWGCEILIPISI